MIQFKQYFNRNVLVESFIDSKNKWIQQGIDPTEVELAIDFYRGLKTRNIIKGQEADIGFWMSKSFEEFNSFINQFKNVKTKTQVKKEIGQDAEKVFENDRAVVIVPKTHAASCKYGAGTKWCTTSKESKHWDQYTKYNVKFYYILTKDKPKNDRYYKVAVVVYLGGDLEIYDAIDDTISIDNFKGVIAEYNIPENIFNNVFNPKKYLERFDHTIDKNGYITINGDFICSHLNLTKLPWKFKRVSGNFNCIDNMLTTLKGAPKTVDGNFDCFRNPLITLEGAPQIVKGDFNCSDNTKLISLDGAPKTVGGGFYCFSNQLTSLDGAPQIVGGFYCNNNKLTTLKNAPQIVDGDFDCSLNKLTSLNGAPQRVGGGFNCFKNQLVTLKGAPQTVGSSFNCSNNKLISLKGAPQTVGGGFYCKNNTTKFTKNIVLKYTKVNGEIYT